jgi:hypothetical protein
VQLIPGDKILIASDVKIGLYDTFSIEATADIPSADPSTWPRSLPIWECNHYERCRGLSQPYSCSNINEFRIIFSTRDAVKGIIIPCRSGEPQPKLVTLMPLNVLSGDDHKRCHFGYNSAAMIDRVASRNVLYYSWPEGSAESSLGPSNFVEFDKGWSNPRSSAFDECSGRVVVDAGDEVIVYNFAKF